jgi:hypothetical protein
MWLLVIYGNMKFLWWWNYGRMIANTCLCLAAMYVPASLLSFFIVLGCPHKFRIHLCVPVRSLVQAAALRLIARTISMVYPKDPPRWSRTLRFIVPYHLLMLVVTLSLAINADRRWIVAVFQFGLGLTWVLIGCVQLFCMITASMYHQKAKVSPRRQRHLRRFFWLGLGAGSLVFLACLYLLYALNGVIHFVWEADIHFITQDTSRTVAPIFILPIISFYSCLAVIPFRHKRTTAAAIVSGRVRRANQGKVVCEALHPQKHSPWQLTALTRRCGNISKAAASLEGALAVLAAKANSTSRHCTLSPSNVIPRMTQAQHTNPAFLLGMAAADLAQWYPSDDSLQRRLILVAEESTCVEGIVHNGQGLRGVSPPITQSQHSPPS